MNGFLYYSNHLPLFSKNKTKQRCLILVDTLAKTDDQTRSTKPSDAIDWERHVRWFRERLALFLFQWLFQPLSLSILRVRSPSHCVCQTEERPRSGRVSMHHNNAPLQEQIVPEDNIPFHWDDLDGDQRWTIVSLCCLSILGPLHSPFNLRLNRFERRHNL